VAVETGSKIGVAGSDGIVTRHHDIVEGRKFELPEGFPRETAKAISVNGARRSAAGDRKTQPGLGELVQSGQYREEPVSRAVGPSEDPRVLLA